MRTTAVYQTRGKEKLNISEEKSWFSCHFLKKDVHVRGNKTFHLNVALRLTRKASVEAEIMARYTS